MDLYVYTDSQSAAAEFLVLKENNPNAAICGPEPYVAIMDAADPDNPQEVTLWPANEGPYWVVMAIGSEIATDAPTQA